ncbi:MAG TPA: NAD-dependent protein deacetylase [Trueperaceae bacterium]|nr:NAD-dependent protein deacetylase [Trueperaceae bacterium]
MTRDGVAAVAALLRRGDAVVLSGAGISTESGIPDYRGPAAAGRERRPITYQEFVRSERARQRYWARSFAGWPFMAARRPNAGHRAVAALEAAGLVSGVVTQNVDGLHQEAGSREVVELHGSLREVRCLSCGTVEARASLQERLAASNQGFLEAAPRYAPDGDADVPEDVVAAFRVAPCAVCGGVLKPQVVFFGENVPRPTYEAARGMVDAARSLLVVGSSLAVRSGYRFVLQAKEAGKPVAVLNDGPTRADGEADLKVEGRLGELLPTLAALAAA